MLLIVSYIENVTGNPRHINEFGHKLGFHPECICKFVIQIILELFFFFVLKIFHNWCSEQLKIDQYSRRRNSSGKHKFQMNDQSFIAAPHWNMITIQKNWTSLIAARSEANWVNEHRANDRANKVISIAATTCLEHRISIIAADATKRFGSFARWQDELMLVCTEGRRAMNKYTRMNEWMTHRMKSNVIRVCLWRIRFL